MSGRLAKKRTKTSKSARAGVLFPVGRMQRYMKRLTHKYRVAAGAPVYMAAVIEYLSAEILELAGNAARDYKRGRVTPRHILLAVGNDEELNQLLKNVTIAQGGVLPKIQPELLKPKKGGKFQTSALTPPLIPLSSSTAGAKKAPKVAAGKVLKSLPKKATAATIRAKKPVMNAKGKETKQDVTGVTILSEKKLFLGQKMTVIQGDIVNVTADALIHPTNGQFSLTGDVGSALEKVGGKEFQQEVRDLLASNGSLDVGGAAICSGHNFLAKFVIHCHPPGWGGGNAHQMLEKCIKNCLALADEKNLKSVAIPAVSQGANGFPKQAAAQVILKAISNHFVTTMSSSLKQIYFVLCDMESIGIYTSELAKLDS
ncbi:PREDICTED: core histone macro-H2A.1-like [Priapulus caudatus]|uniref:Core histone macro-H2A.1-like n=1 Tax=Priapulus caudatus TaxID=37621 RepID=A0ABM1EDP0_PRICU|nr:PREDICTED: core histone macro-H2A.1-like [Priapulus caudatus]